MDIGIPRETTPDEFRVALVPDAVHCLIDCGHRVFVEHDAGDASGFEDEAYAGVGAVILPDCREVFRQSQIIVKVNAPGREESAGLGPDHLVLAYFHFSGSLTRTELMLHTQSVCIGYETVALKTGAPLLAPMSDVGGQLAALIGANLLAQSPEGRGILPGGLPGVRPASVLVLGGGRLGSRAARVMAALGADVIVVDHCPACLARLHDTLPPNIHTEHASGLAIERLVPTSDLVIGAVGQGAERTPVLVRRELVQQMARGSVVVDATADQGGCLETTRSTSWVSPTFEVGGVLHCCVANLAGRAGRSASRALSAALLPYVRKLAEEGYRAAARADHGLAEGIQLIQGRITHPDVASAFGMEHVAVASLLG